MFAEAVGLVEPKLQRHHRFSCGLRQIVCHDALITHVLWLRVITNAFWLRRHIGQDFMSSSSKAASIEHPSAHVPAHANSCAGKHR